MNPLVELNLLDQKVWLDTLSRRLLDTGDLATLIEAGEVTGVTSNPTIFERAIVGSDDYREDAHALAAEGLNASAIYRRLTTEDIRRAADLLRPIYDRSNGRDGFVSLEVSPRLAYDTAGTVVEAHELWATVGRPNLFIKVPATKEGLGAIRRLVSDGVNINVTLLFGLQRYREVADAFAAGLDDRYQRGEPVNTVSSVASFFLSRIDVFVDDQLDALVEAGHAAPDAVRILKGETAIASAKIAYQIYKQEVLTDERFKRLAARGRARPQRLLWASTGTKNPAYSEIKYVEPLIGPATINTMPSATLQAYRNHGHPSYRLECGVDEAHMRLQKLSEVGIDLDSVTQQLEDEGVEKFSHPYEATMDGLSQLR